MDDLTLTPDPMVSTDWLIKHIDHPRIIAVDGTWCMPGQDMPYPDTFIAGPHLDIDEVADKNNPLAHMLPTADEFQAAARGLGLNADSIIICYDRHGLGTAQRIWWMFRAMGHDNVRVLDGGLPAWLAAGQPVVNTPVTGAPGNFVAHFRPHLLVSKADVLERLKTDQILDARPEGRFTGAQPEPREGLSSGHMPGAICLPFASLKTEDGFLKSKSELDKIFNAAAIDMNAPIITSCGSGVTACGIALALARLGIWSASVYDGSWTEWASSQDCPIVKDTA